MRTISNLLINNHGAIKTLQTKILNIKHLRIFVVVAKCKSISGASKYVFLSQPAMTQALQKLEKTIGHALFERKSDGMYLTNEGEALFFRVDRALMLLQKGIKGTLELGSLTEPRKAEQLISLITHTQLNSLVAICQQQSLTLASKALGVASSTLSRSVKNLSQILSVALFTKSSTGLNATPAAQVLASATLVAYEELSQAKDELATLGSSDQGQIKIGCIPITDVNLLANDITEFCKRYPKVNISINSGESSEQLLKLRHAKLDFFLGILALPNPHKDLSQELLAKADLVIAARYNHPLANRSAISLEELAGQSWVVSKPQSATRVIFDRIFSHCQQFDANNLIEATSSRLKNHILERSDNLTLVTCRQIQSELESQKLTIIPFTLNNARVPIGLYYRKDWQASIVQQQFLEIMRATSTMINQSGTPHA